MTNEKDGKDGVDNQGFSKETLNDNSTKSGSFKVTEIKPSINALESKRSYDLTEDDDTVDLSCGIWKLRTNILGRFFANLYVFSICMGLSSFFAMMVSSVLHIQIVSIQRQFDITNAKTGMFDMASKIGSLCTILFAGHFAKKVHIPMIVGIAGILQGIIVMIPAFLELADPHLLPTISRGGGHSNITNKTDFGDNGQYLCRDSPLTGQTIHSNVSVPMHYTTPATKTHSDNTELKFAVLVVVQAMKGVTDAFHSGFLPALYLDDNMLDKSRMGKFFGLNMILTELALPVGKQINGLLSNVPIDLKQTEMDPKDIRFVAAWWLAYLIFGAGTVLFSIPVMLFPRKLVSKREQEEALKKAMISFTAGGMPSSSSGTEESENKANDTEKSPSNDPTGINPARPTSLYGKNLLAPRISQQSGSNVAIGYISRKRSSLLPPINGPTERRVSIDGTMVFDQPIKQKRSKTKEESIQGSSDIKELLKDFPKAFIRVFTRPVFILIIIDIIIASITMSGTATFRSQYILYEYNVSMSEVAMLTGVTQAVGQLLGTLIGGFLANRVKTKMGYNYIIVGTYLLSILVTPMYIIFGCNNDNIYGHEGNLGVPVNMTDTCSCKGTKELLACGNDSNTYLSPCYAGCQEVIGKTFTKCSGLDLLNGTQSVTLTPGVCGSDCRTNFLLYVILHAVQLLLSSMANIPRRLLILRMVDPRDRGFATSVFAFSSILISIPSPNLFGKLIDNTCVIWNKNACSLYDRDKIRYLISGLDVAVNIAIQITMFFIIFFFRREEKALKKKLEHEADEEATRTERGIKI